MIQSVFLKMHIGCCVDWKWAGQGEQLQYPLNNPSEQDGGLDKGGDKGAVSRLERYLEGRSNLEMIAQIEGNRGRNSE